jgi:hypothetical protein
MKNNTVENVKAPVVENSQNTKTYPKPPSFYSDVSNIFEPDVVVPGQFYSADLGGLQGGERKLMAALLSDGVQSFISQTSCGSAEEDEETASDAWKWVTTVDKDYIFSFDCVCDCLGIDPDYLRAGLNRYVEKAREQNKEGQGMKAWRKIRRPRK